METVFWNVGLSYTNHKLENSKRTGLRVFRSFYGCSPQVCSKIWSLIEKTAPVASRPKHLLWCLLFLKRYNTEHVNSAITHVDEKTFRGWVWIFVRLLADLKVVRIFTFYLRII